MWEILQCRHEPSNEVDENEIAIIRTDSSRKELLDTCHKTFQKYAYYSWKCETLKFQHRKEVDLWRWLWSGDSSNFPLSWTRKVSKLGCKRLKAVKSQLDCQVSKCLK